MASLPLVTNTQIIRNPYWALRNISHHELVLRTEYYPLVPGNYQDSSLKGSLINPSCKYTSVLPILATLQPAIIPLQLTSLLVRRLATDCSRHLPPVQPRLFCASKTNNCGSRSETTKSQKPWLSATAAAATENHRRTKSPRFRALYSRSGDEGDSKIKGSRMYEFAVAAALGLIGFCASSWAADLQPLQVPVSTEWSVVLPFSRASNHESDLLTGSDTMEVGARTFPRPAHERVTTADTCCAESMSEWAPHSNGYHYFQAHSVRKPG